MLMSLVEHQLKLISYIILSFLSRLIKTIVTKYVHFFRSGNVKEFYLNNPVR